MVDAPADGAQHRDARGAAGHRLGQGQFGVGGFFALRVADHLAAALLEGAHRLGIGIHPVGDSPILRVAILPLGDVTDDGFQAAQLLHPQVIVGVEHVPCARYSEVAGAFAHSEDRGKDARIEALALPDPAGILKVHVSPPVYRRASLPRTALPFPIAGVSSRAY